MDFTNKSIILIALLLVFIFSSSARADYYPNEKPVWGLTQDTAFLLEPGQWYIDVLGWTTYGMANNFQIGSNFWLDMAQLLNMYTKLQIVEEGQNNPAVSLGASYYTTITGFGSVWDTTLYLTKTIDTDNRWLYTSIKYVNIAATAPTRTGSIILFGGNATNLTLGLITQNAPHWRSFLELAYDSTSSSASSRGGGGFEWAFDLWRYRLGGYISQTFFTLILDLGWRF